MGVLEETTIVVETGGGLGEISIIDLVLEEVHGDDDRIEEMQIISKIKELK